MAKDLWLPKGFELPDRSRIKALLHSGDEWQIVATDGSNNVLMGRPELVTRWTDSHLLEDGVLWSVSHGKDTYRGLSCNQRYALVPVDYGTLPACKVDALAFAYALNESRKISEETSFHDALYVEQYSRLLPTWTLTAHMPDEVVMGTWLTGGVVISTESFRRLTKLTGRIPVQDLVEIIGAAGLSVPSDACLLANRKTASHNRVQEKHFHGVQDGDGKKVRELQTERKSQVFSLPGRPKLEKFFNEHIIDIISNGRKYEALGIDFPAAIVLHGPSGCGKTYAVDRLTEFLDWPSFAVNSSIIGSPYIHETSKKISEVFDKAIEGAPSVIIIDEMESFLSDRFSGSGSGLHHVEEVGEFLRRIPEAIARRVLVIGMTNLIEMIDPAILRRGRFDHVIEVGWPSREEVEALVDSLLSTLPKAMDLKMESVVDVLTGRALSDSAFMVREAARLAARSGKVLIDQESLDAAAASLPGERETHKTRIGFI